MLLMDQVAQARTALVVESRTGRRSVPSAADRAQAVAACPLRYVVEPNAADRCRSLLVTDRGMLAAENELLRMPAPELWIEWIEPEGRRTGCLVNAAEDGRAGTVETFWEQENGEPVHAQAAVHFDFHGTAEAPLDGRRAFGLLPGAHPLRDSMWFVLDEEWMAYFEEGDLAAARSAIGTVVNTLIPTFELLLAFSALFTSRPILVAQRADLAKLNRKRKSNGRKPLLEHLKIKLDLDHAARLQGAGAIDAGSVKRPSRLHYVTGHMVRRGPAVFWRRSHLRGDASRTIISKRVTVSWSDELRPPK